METVHTKRKVLKALAQFEQQVWQQFMETIQIPKTSSLDKIKEDVDGAHEIIKYVTETDHTNEDDLGDRFQKKVNKQAKGDNM